MPTDGCRDIDAANYSVLADQACDDDCCSYPKLTLLASHRMGDTVWVRDSVYHNSLGQPYDIGYIVMVVSDVRLTTGTDTIRMRERVEVIRSGVDRSFVDDFTIVSTGEFRFEVGSFITNGPVDQLLLRFGSAVLPLDAVVSPTNYTGLSYPDSLLVLGDLYPAAVVYFDSIGTRADEVVAIASMDVVSLQLDTTLQRGRGLSVEVNLDYQRWLSDIDFDAPPDAVSHNIAKNLGRAWLLR